MLCQKLKFKADDFHEPTACWELESTTQHSWVPLSWRCLNHFAVVVVESNPMSSRATDFFYNGFVYNEFEVDDNE